MNDIFGGKWEEYDFFSFYLAMFDIKNTKGMNTTNDKVKTGSKQCTEVSFPCLLTHTTPSYIISFMNLDHGCRQHQKRCTFPFVPLIWMMDSLSRSSI